MRPPKATFRRHGSPWSTADGQTFQGLRTDSGLHSLPGAVDLSAGMVVFRADSQSVRYLVTAVEDHTIYQTAQITPAEYLALIYRNVEGTRDSFGMLTDDAPTLIYEGVPLVLVSSSSRSAAPEDRPTGDTSYLFTAPSSYDLKVNDQIDSGAGTRLFIQSIRLSSPGLTEIKAVSA